MQKANSAPPAEPSLFLSRTHAAALADVSIQLIDKYLRAGKLRRYSLGRKVLVKREELLRVMEEFQ